MKAPTRTQEFCKAALTNRDQFWAEQAQAIYWHRPFDQICDFTRPPFARWFVGGQTNLSYNAIDRHLADRANQPALHFISTEVETEATYSFQDTYEEVNAFAAVLQSLGARRGDRAVIYLPMIPEAVFAMLACARLGIIHSVVFAGFAPASLGTRIDDAEASILITADTGLRGGKVIPLKRLADDAIRLAKLPPKRVLVCDRGLDPDMPWTEGRDYSYSELRAKHRDEKVPVEWLEATDSSYLLYTSGTTAKPKGIQRDVGGYAVALATSMKYLFAGEPGQVMFTAADVGWAVGHSYGVYGPMLHGMTTILYEGLPIKPDGGIWWKIVERYRAAIMFTSPTAIRTLKRQDPALLRKYDTGSLQRLYLAGEPLDEPTWKWISDALQVPVIDNYWQTETGWPVLALLPKVEPPSIKPGSPGVPMPGYDARIVDPVTGRDLPPNQKGILALGLPLPPGCMPTVWKDDNLFANHYCHRFSEVSLYSTFDYAIQDEDGYFFILGRSDDVINVAGHRLGTREIEETICSHPAVAEAAAVGAIDELKGQAVHCFVVVKRSEDYPNPASEDRLKKEIESTVVSQLGSFSRPAAIHVIRALPKTRSGKVLRRAILAAAEGRETGDLSTLEDPVALDAIREVIERRTGDR
ncbi:MAG: propionate--CoA ligase [Verrucomicrobia bacterium]|nr:propionate--CoA ligase [Verrucomicrobiota bacterium]